MKFAEAAMKLNGCQYREEGSRELFAEMKASGLVAVFGASDDLVELRGAIDEELGAWNGTTFYVNRDGLLQNKCPDADCPYFAKLEKSATPIMAIWGGEHYSWTYETEIRHAKFVVLEDGEAYCEGIVFALADVSS